MKVLILCDNHANQRALAHKINHSAKVDEIIVISGNMKKRLSLNKYFGDKKQKLGTIITGFKFRRVWFGMLNHYKKMYPKFPIRPRLNCKDVKDLSVIERVAAIRPNLVIVSGTNILKKPLIDEILKHGKIMNLHTGISPYIKGGPNCTNWCLFLKEFGLIGNTVMWLDSGIDSGNIILTEATPLSGKETLLELHIKVMNHAHLIYVSMINQFINGATLPNVPQSEFEKHRLFLSKHWGPYQMLVALFNFYYYFRPGSKYFSTHDGVKLVSYDL